MQRLMLVFQQNTDFARSGPGSQERRHVHVQTRQFLRRTSELSPDLGRTRMYSEYWNVTLLNTFRLHESLSPEGVCYIEIGGKIENVEDLTTALAQADTCDTLMFFTRANTGVTKEIFRIWNEEAAQAGRKPIKGVGAFNTSLGIVLDYNTQAAHQIGNKSVSMTS